ncbi:hypothetical protein SAMN05428988_5542 [Chitinophaga sp. YR573]|uniref:hypothetical protein n=1 Tax=Chitinophaga sp. YR573 TaxID=1881040 RepID=UPI0008CCC777|nr:hypothetical protein [Chitinophaga sp. YR573]SEW43392.1 hypothetical protein SAMN05428988_5542 [Chitinophaga sp. YR573]
MKAAGLTEIKKELNAVPPAQLVELCLRLAKFKKDNKELLSYLLFESHNLQGYIEAVKENIDTEFAAEPGRSHVYFIKKHLRKILRNTNKQIKYTGSKQAEIELLLYFCTKVKEAGIKVNDSLALSNLYQQQLRKIEKAISAQHEDLQYDYLRQLEKL